MSLQDFARAEGDMIAAASPKAHDLEPQPLWPIETVEQCVAAIEDLALDVGYFVDLVQAARRVDAIKNWIAREKARIAAACPLQR